VGFFHYIKLRLFASLFPFIAYSISFWGLFSFLFNCIILLRQRCRGGLGRSVGRLAGLDLAGRDAKVAERTEFWFCNSMALGNI
jgi:hypothetical protein